MSPQAKHLEACGDTATECGSAVVAVWCYSHLEHMFVTITQSMCPAAHHHKTHVVSVSVSVYAYVYVYVYVHVHVHVHMHVYG